MSRPTKPTIVQLSENAQRYERASNRDVASDPR